MTDPNLIAPAWLDWRRAHIAAAIALVSLLVNRLDAADVDFSRDVRPLLSHFCFKCHGPDAEQRQSGLRLDTRAGALGAAESGSAAIVPGRPDDSELVRRINSPDIDERMPPAETRLTLSDAQKRLLRDWIAGGAPYAQHWAFVPPQRPLLPEIVDSAVAGNAIDVFVRARLAREGLRPAPEADRLTLIRRVFLDLIGLPPTPAEADRFVNDAAPDAYEQLVDRLLASPRCGERWARPWLDLARYADTNGYEKDRPRSIWPYRDWVISALNADMPFDRFTIEQLAGDMLPDATLSSQIATGFHRNTMLNEEGGIDPLEFRYYAMTDRVATTGTVWLGLTLGCAQCHTHKFDPITQREYYQFMAFLDNADEPKLAVPLAELAARRTRLEQQLAASEDDLAQHFPVPDDPNDARPVEQRRRDRLEAGFRSWLDAECKRAVDWRIERPASVHSNLAKLDILEDGSVLASGDQSKRDVYELMLRGDMRGVTALRLEVLPHDSLPRCGPGRAYYEGPDGDFFLSELQLEGASGPLKFAGASETYGKLGIGDAPSSAALAIDGNPHSGWSTSGREGTANSAVFRLAHPLAGDNTLTVRLVFERHYAAALGHFRLSVTRDPRDVSARPVPAAVEALLVRAADRLTDEEKRQLRRYYLSVAPELAAERERLARLRAQIPEYPTTLVLAERPADNPRHTFLHRRGQFLQLGQEVTPGVPGFLPPLPAAAPRNRLSLARWLVDRGNPLVARVTVNRHWATLFGHGLVRTTEDFGYQGEPPTHPELLDWLAVEFMDQGWSIKELHRLIVTSATYRQSSRASAELLARDPENRLLARGPSVRLEAELIRDVALGTAGLLSSKLGGPSVFPPQPPSVTTEGSYGRLEWKVSPGEDRYRRGLYTFSKRTAPFAMFTNFDAPSGEACVARREVSNTPLQALTLLNDTVFVEAAQALGTWAAARSEPLDERLVIIFRRCLTRPPAAAERQALAEFYRTQRQRLAAGELNAESISGGREGDMVERAAWTLVARALLNLDEMVTKN